MSVRLREAPIDAGRASLPAELVEPLYSLERTMAAAAPPRDTARTLPAPKPSTLLLALAYLAFVSLGLPDTVLGIAWPSLQAEFELPREALGMPIAFGTAAYFVSGFFAGRLTRTAGIGLLLTGSSALVAIAVSVYAGAPAFGVFLAASCVIGFGSGAVDAGLNTYAATQFGPRHMAWLHAAYSVGAALGPAIMTAFVARADGWRSGYAAIAGLLALLAVAFALTRRRWSALATKARSAAPVLAAQRPLGTLEALRRPSVRLQALAFFIYTGVEVGAGQWSYTILTQSRGLPPERAGLYVTAYWTSLLVGRVLSGFVVERTGTTRLIRWGSIGALLGATLFAISSSALGALGLALIGLCIAPIFPGLMSETPRRVGPDVAAHAVGLQVSAATLGVAVLPNVGGVIGTGYGLEAIAVFIAGCALSLCAVHERIVRVADPRG